MRIVALLLLVSSLLFSASSKKIEVIPADVTYSIENVNDFSELLFDAVLNAVAEYNFAQTEEEGVFAVTTGPTASAKYAKNIKNAHKKIKKDSLGYMKKRHLTKLITMDFNTKKVNNMMKKCKRKCKTQVNFTFYELDKKPVAKKLTYEYDGKICVLTDRSTDKINHEIEAFLRK